MADTPQNSAAAPAQTQAAKDPAAALAAATKTLAAEIKADAAKDGGWDPGSDPLTSDSGAAGNGAPDDGGDDSGDTSIDDDSGDEDGDNGDSEGAEASANSGVPAGLDPELAALVKAKDLDGLAAKLGIKDPADFFKVKAEDFKAIRHERRKLDKSATKLAKLETDLRAKYSDPVVARKAFAAGDLNTYFQTLEKWSGVPHSEVQKAWALHVQGKPVPKLEPKTSIVVAAPAADEAKIVKLKERIAGDIKANPLSSKPGIVDLVFAKMKAKWNDGVRTPDAALKLVAADLKAASAADRALLRKAGVLPKKTGKGNRPAARTVATPSHSAVVTSASTGGANTSRPMTDRELAQDVMKGLGKDAWR